MANVSVVNFPRHGIAVDDRHKKMCPPEVVMEIHEHDENKFRFLYVFVYVLFRFIGFMFHIDAGTIYMRDWFSGVRRLIVSVYVWWMAESHWAAMPVPLHNFFLTAIASDFFM